VYTVWHSTHDGARPIRVRLFRGSRRSLTVLAQATRDATAERRTGDGAVRVDFGHLPVVRGRARVLLRDDTPLRLLAVPGIGCRNLVAKPDGRTG